MAENLVGMMATAFEPSEYKDEYKQAVLQLVEAKVQKKEIIEAPEPETETTVVDLMSALKASVEKAKKGEAKTKRAASAPSSRTARRRRPRDLSSFVPSRERERPEAGAHPTLIDVGEATSALPRALTPMRPRLARGPSTLPSTSSS